MNRFFKFEERGTNMRTETLAGITTFLSMAYIMIVNPIILGDAGLDKGAVFTATGLTIIFGTLLMGLFANYPIGVAPSMGLNAFFAYGVVINLGVSPATALTGVLFSAILFTILSVIKIREKIINAIPANLKAAVSSGIGFFIAFIGLKNAGIVTGNKDTLVTVGDFSDPATLLAVIGLVITVIFLVRGIGGGIFYGMVITTIIGMIAGIISVPHAIIGQIPSLAPTFGLAFQHIDQIFTWKLLIVIFTFLFVSFFDTAGTLIAIATQAGLIKDNKIPNVGRALVSDSLSAVFGSIMGTSNTASYIESSAGIAAGGRTGFTSVIIAFFFFLSLFFSPLLSVVTSQVTAPALIIVGSLMALQLKGIEWEKPEVAIPAFIILITMPLTYSIADGIALGFILYPIAMLAAKKHREVHPIMYILFVIFILYFAFAA